MNEAQVISVNPAMKTLGELGGSLDTIARIGRHLAAPCRKISSPLKKFVNFVSGINAKVSRNLSSRLLLVRFVCGAAMLVSVLLPMSPQAILSFDFSVWGLLACTVGLSLLFGLFTRLTTAAAALCSGYMFSLSLVALQPDALTGLVTLLMAVFMVLGPGIFSTDQLIRLGIFKMRRNLLRRIKNRRQRKVVSVEPAVLSYRAYSEAERRV